MDVGEGNLPAEVLVQVAYSGVLVMDCGVRSHTHTHTHTYVHSRSVKVNW